MRVNYFAPKKITSKSEEIDFQTQTAAKFTANGKQISTVTNGAVVSSIAVRLAGQTGSVAPAGLILQGTMIPASNSSGISIVGNSIQLTQPGLYQFAVQINCTAAAGFRMNVYYQIAGVNQDQTHEASPGGVTGLPLCPSFYLKSYLKTTTTTETLPFFIASDSFDPTGGAQPVIDNAGEIQVIHSRFVDSS